MMRAALLICLTAAACNRDAQGPAPMTNAPSDRLVVVVDTDRSIEMGYGYRWHATVKQVVEGKLADAELWLEVHGADVYNGHFQCCDPEQNVQVVLQRIAARPAALAGFVAKDGTVWEIVDVKK